MPEPRNPALTTGFCLGFAFCSPRCLGSGWGLINRNTGVSLRSLQDQVCLSIRAQISGRKSGQKPAFARQTPSIWKQIVFVFNQSVTHKKCPRFDTGAGVLLICSPRCRGSGWGLINRNTGVSLRSLQDQVCLSIRAQIANLIGNGQFLGIQCIVGNGQFPHRKQS